MGCSCCANWMCYQCCCPDGSAPRASIAVRVVANNTARVDFQVFEGSYTLTHGADPIFPPLFNAGPLNVITPKTCVYYNVSQGAGCGGFGTSQSIEFYRESNGFLSTCWAFSGPDELGRCSYAWGYANKNPAAAAFADLCAGGSGLLFEGLTFFVQTAGIANRQAAFDVYLD